MKIGILGGTFDPIHNVHLMIAEQVREERELDEIWFVPTHVPPHKDGRQVASAEHRLQMIRLGIQGVSYFKVSSFEIDRSGKSYTIKTVQALIKKFPGYDFSFIIGGDMIDYLPQWYQIDHLINLIQFIGVRRPGNQVEDTEFTSAVAMVDVPQMDISSTVIRDKIASKKSIRFLVPEQVQDYIKENSLYES